MRLYFAKIEYTIANTLDRASSRREGSRQTMLRTLTTLMIALFLTGCAGEQAFWTVSEVWQNAEKLQGKQLRVRGLADFRLAPYHPLQVGGCSLDQDVVKRSQITGSLALRDEEADDPKQIILISASSLQCQGNICRLTCKPFAPTEAATWGGSELIEAFELVGTLKVEGRGSEEVLILEKLDLQMSRRRANGMWEPIPSGDFTYNFP